MIGYPTWALKITRMKYYKMVHTKHNITKMHSVISAKLDNCNSLFVDIPDFLITKLQRVQNAAARTVLNLKKYDSVTPYLMKLHWLSIRQRIIYKLNLIVFKALKGDAPDYIQSLISINQLARPLRSGDKMYKLKEPRWKLKARDTELSMMQYLATGIVSPMMSATSKWIYMTSRKDLKPFYLRVLLLE